LQEIFCPARRYNDQLETVWNTSETIFHGNASHIRPLFGDFKSFLIVDSAKAKRKEPRLF
jgi:hypothetical protein